MRTGSLGDPAFRQDHEGDFYQALHASGQLERMALSKALAPVKPQVNRAFNPSLHPEVLDEATNQRSRRY
jgi:hypothetical protein